MGIINEDLLIDVFGITGTTIQQVAPTTQEELMPVKEKRSNQSPQKRYPELFSYRHKKYKSFKEAFWASGFTPFTVDKFGRGKDDYSGKESEMLNYLTKLYTNMYAGGQMEYQKIELEKVLKKIDELREYV